MGFVVGFFFSFSSFRRGRGGTNSLVARILFATREYTHRPADGVGRGFRMWMGRSAGVGKINESQAELMWPGLRGLHGCSFGAPGT